MRALLSVSDREGIVELARGLTDAGAEIFATDGTRAHLTDAGLADIRPVSELTETNEILGGRVKTLHPKIFAGLLARRDQPDHMAQLAEHGIEQIDLVVVNLYPFAQTVRDPSTSLDEALEQIDIGGVALLRAAAKNFPGVAAVSSPTQYASVLRDIKTLGGVSPETRQKLAGEAFARHRVLRRADRELPERRLRHRLPDPPHDGRREEGGPALRREPASARRLLHRSCPRRRQHQLRAPDRRQGPQLQQPARPRRGLDDRVGLQDPGGLDRQARQSCGLASVVDLAEAFRLALEGDSVSAYGGVIGVNRTIDEPTARAIRPGFFEAIVAPGYTPEALEILRTKRGFEIVEVPPTDHQVDELGIGRFDFKRIGGGLLVQTFDEMDEDRDKLQPVTQRRPTLEELTDLLFAWRAVRHVKSNAVVLAKKHAMVGMGAGQPSRVVSVEVALRKAGERAPLSVMASDAYFPFPDGIQIAAQAGVTAIIQPGGSIRDEMAIEVADRHHMAMVFTGRRHFKH